MGDRRRMKRQYSIATVEVTDGKLFIDCATYDNLKEPLDKFSLTAEQVEQLLKFKTINLVDCLPCKAIRLVNKSSGPFNE